METDTLTTRAEAAQWLIDASGEGVATPDDAANNEQLAEALLAVMERRLTDARRLLVGVE